MNRFVMLLLSLVVFSGLGFGAQSTPAVGGGDETVGTIPAVAGDQVLRSSWVSNGVTQVVETTRRANENERDFSKRHDALCDERRRTHPPDTVQHGEHFNGMVGEVWISTWTNTEAGRLVMTTTLETPRYQNPLEPGNEWRLRHGTTLRIALRYLPGKS